MSELSCQHCLLRHWLATRFVLITRQPPQCSNTQPSRQLISVTIMHTMAAATHVVTGAFHTSLILGQPMAVDKKMRRYDLLSAATMREHTGIPWLTGSRQWGNDDDILHGILYIPLHSLVQGTYYMAYHAYIPWLTLALHSLVQGSLFRNVTWGKWVTLDLCAHAQLWIMMLSHYRGGDACEHLGMF